MEDKPKKRSVEESGSAAAANPLEALAKRLADLDQEILDADRKVREARERVRTDESDLEQSLSAKRDREMSQQALKQMLSDLQNNLKFIEQQRQGASSDLKSAGDDYQSIVDALAEDLDDAARASLDEALQEIDSEIDGLHQENTTLMEQGSDLENAAIQAKTKVTQSAAAVKAAQNMLRQRAQAIQAARGAMTRAHNALKDAYKKGEFHEAYLMAGELKTARDRLTEVLDPQRERDMVDAVTAAWSEWQDAKQADREKSQALKDHQVALTLSTTQLADLEKTRWERIRERIQEIQAANPPVKAQPEAEPA